MTEPRLDRELEEQEERPNREIETRDSEARTPRWQQPSVLPSPDPRPGWIHRWVRVALQGQPDPTNISSKLREGWEPCKVSEYPEIKIVYVENQDFKDNVLMGGCLLCRAPEELVKQRNEFYQTQTAAQMKSVNENLMRESDPRMPVFNNSKSSVTFGKGSHNN